MEELNNSTILAIWNDVKQGGIPLLVMTFIALLLFIKPYTHNILTFLGNLITLKFGKKSKSYTLQDIKNHQIFKDLNFWLEMGIDSINLNNTHVGFPFSSRHKEADDYVKAKEQIAKDVLRIKFTVVKEYLETLIKDNDLEKIDLESAKRYVEEYLNKCQIKQYNQMKEIKIPEPFLKKYFVYEQMALEFLNQTINSYLDEKSFDLDILTRIYLIFNALNTYLADTYNTMLSSVAAINGDLNGCDYKGKIIGEKREEIIQPPHSSYTYSCREELKKVMTEFGASRCYLMKYYTNSKNEDVHSTVYEVCDVGIMPMINKVQNIANNMESEVLAMLKNGTVISVDISKFNNFVSKRLTERGINAIILTPVFGGNEFSGVLALDYLSINEYEAHKNIENMDEKLKNYAAELSTFLTYPDDYKF